MLKNDFCYKERHKHPKKDSSTFARNATNNFRPQDPESTNRSVFFFETA